MTSEAVGKKRKGERTERKRREKEKKREILCAHLELPRGTTKENPSVFQPFEVIS